MHANLSIAQLNRRVRALTQHSVRLLPGLQSELQHETGRSLTDFVHAIKTFDEELHVPRLEKFKPSDFTVANHWIEGEHQAPDGVSYPLWASSTANLALFCFAEGGDVAEIYQAISKYRKALHEKTHGTVQQEYYPGKELNNAKTFQINDQEYSLWKKYLEINFKEEIGFHDSVFSLFDGRREFVLGKITKNEDGFSITHFSRSDSEFESLFKLAFKKIDKLYDKYLLNGEVGDPYDKALYIAEVFYLLTNLHPWERGGDAIHRSFFSALATKVLHKKTIIPSGADLFAMLSGDQEKFIRIFAQYLAYGIPMDIPGHTFNIPRDRKEIKINKMNFNLPEILSGKGDVTFFLKVAEEKAKEFSTAYMDPLNPTEPLTSNLPTTEEIQKFNKWFATEEGEVFQQRFSERIWEIMESVSGFGHPGHDRRHILYADPVSGLRILEQESFNGYSSLAMAGCLLHDIGRLVETSLEGEARLKSQAKHAEFSFLVTKELLADFTEIPESIRNELLCSILMHSSGKCRSSYYSQVVQTSDRLQLNGAESVARQIGYFMTYYNGEFFSEISNENQLKSELKIGKEGLALDTVLEFYLRHLYPSIGKHAQLEMQKLSVSLGRFLLIISDVEHQQQIFYPEFKIAGYRDFDVANTKKLLPQYLFDYMFSKASAAVLVRAYYNYDDVKTNLNKILSLKLAAHPKDIDVNGTNGYQIILDKLDKLSTAQQARLNEGLKYALAEISCREDKDSEFLHEIENMQPNVFITNLARRIRDVTFS